VWTGRSFANAAVLVCAQACARVIGNQQPLNLDLRLFGKIYVSIQI